MQVTSSDRRTVSAPARRRGNLGGPIILVTLFVLVSVVGVVLVLWDGQAGQARINAEPPAGSVEGNLAQQANWYASPIRDYIAKNGKLPSESEGATLLSGDRGSAPPVFYPPTPAGNAKPTYRQVDDGFELVFPGTDGKPVVCRFSAEGAYEGATGLGEFTKEKQGERNPLKGTPR